MTDFDTTPGPGGSYAADPDDVWGLPERAELDHPPTEAELRRTRAQASLALRIRGASFEDIAETQEYRSAAEARGAVEQLLASMAEADGSAAWQTQRQLHQLRLEGLLKSVYERAIDDTDDLHLAYNKRAVEVLDRITKLQGFDMPQRSIVYTPEAGEFDLVVQSVLASSKVSQSVEGDIFELEELPEIVIEEGDFDDAPETEH